MPATLERVGRILERLRQHGLGRASLLVVPGLAWSDDQVATLRSFAADGHDLAGHGWRHSVRRIRGLKHRLHALTISRNVAEHLELDAAGIRRLVTDCGAWFGAHSLPQPSLYVPPAWALGGIPWHELGGLGFRYFETLAGIYDTADGTMRRLPLLGFEADTRFRAASLRLFNAANRGLARRAGIARLAIHPRDFELELAGDLERALDASSGSVSVHESFSRR